MSRTPALTGSRGPQRDRRFRPVSLLLVAVALGGSVVCGRRVEARTDDKKTSAVDIARYLLPFGTNPYSPSEAKSTFTGFLDPAKVPTAAYCGQCHARIYQEWRESAHANSFRTPWYVKNVDLLIQQKGIAFTRHCEGCHNPIALFSGVLTPASKVARPFDDDGVTCVSCHAVTGTQPARGLGSYVVGVPAALVDAQGVAVEGMPAPAEILAHLDRHRAAVMHITLQTPEFCGSCHKANLPQTLNGYKWLRAFTTYDEWQQSGWSGQSPVAFFKKQPRSCHTCHMPLVQGPDPAAVNGAYHSHRWAAANTMIPAQYKYPEQQAAVKAFLRNGALRVDIFALSLDAGAAPGKHPQLGPVIAPIDTSHFSLQGGKPVTISVVVQNTGIGHSLVPEQRDFYESWLAVEVTDEAGRMVYQSGAMSPEHRLKPDTHVFNNQIVSKDGKRLIHHEVWNVTARAYDSTVSAGRADVERYRFIVPASCKTLTVHAAVKYRRFRREFTDWVFGDAASAPDRSPTVTMAEDTITLRRGENFPAKEGGVGKPPEEIRFAAFGIGMLDRQDFAASTKAFERMIALQPRQADGYIDLGVALYTEGDFSAALKSLGKAEVLEPENQRARYYEGLCYRWQYRYPQAIAALRSVARAYPRFRQVHDDLGWLLLIEHQYGAARDEFEAAVGIDPDDVMAHKWLSAVYGKLGNPQRAAEEAVLEAQLKDDPAAQWRVLGYWRGNPDVADEVTPGHVHGENATDPAEVQGILNTQNPPSMVWIQH